MEPHRCSTHLLVECIVASQSVPVAISATVVRVFDAARVRYVWCDDVLPRLWPINATTFKLKYAGRGQEQCKICTKIHIKTANCTQTRAENVFDGNDCAKEHRKENPELHFTGWHTESCGTTSAYLASFQTSMILRFYNPRWDCCLIALMLSDPSVDFEFRCGF